MLNKKYACIALAIAIIASACDDSIVSDENYARCETVHPNGKSFPAIDIWRAPDSIPPAPVIVFIHGGGWNSGDKSIWDERFADSFMQHHIISTSVNYILWPDGNILQQIKDIDTSIKWIKTNIRSFGGDPSRIFIMGHSAGAHLAAIYALSHKLQGAICIDGGEYLTELPENMSVSSDYYKELREAFVKVVVENDELKCIPYYQITEEGTNPFFLYYQRDESYRRQPNEKFGAMLSKHNHDVTIFPQPQCDHMGIYFLLSDPQSAPTVAMASFIHSY